MKRTILSPKEQDLLERLRTVHDKSMDEWEQELIEEGKSPEEAKSIINNYR